VEGWKHHRENGVIVQLLNTPVLPRPCVPERLARKQKIPAAVSSVEAASIRDAIYGSMIWSADIATCHGWLLRRNAALSLSHNSFRLEAVQPRL
jgi:hypothetical protein